MKKYLMVFLTLFLLTLTFALTPTVHAEAPNTVYLSDSGSDDNAGTEDAPYLTLGKALAEVSNNGTIRIKDTFSLTLTSTWPESDKTVTITGGTLDLTDWSNKDKNLVIGNSVIFENIALKFKQIELNDTDHKTVTAVDRVSIFANGHHVVIRESVTFTQYSKVYVQLLGGGTKGATINGGTNLEVYAGVYDAIYGGGYSDTIKGDTHLTVGGAVNPAAYMSEHTGYYRLYGGGLSGTIEGSTNVTVTAGTYDQIYGGGNGGTIKGNTNMTATADTCDRIFGGGKGGTIQGNTNLTVTAGTYDRIFGGGNGDTIKGDTRVTVGGTVNPNVSWGWFDHASKNLLFGGGSDDTIEGSTYLTVKGNAKARYAYGGSAGTGKHISGYTNAIFESGTLMSLAGGNWSADAGALGANVTMTGGTVEQVFGGNIIEVAGRNGDLGSAEAPATVNVRILGGTVSRRIYGGCYNNYESNYISSYHVHGNIVLTLGADVKITLDGKPENALCARSRYKTPHNAEKTTIVYTSTEAYKAFNSKLTRPYSDSTSTKGADEQHICAYAVSGNTVTETCSLTGCNHTGTATFKLDPDASLVYTGKAITPATVEYSGWKGETSFAIAYSNNINAGEATATLSNTMPSYTLDDATLTFTIAKAPSLHVAPALGYVGNKVTGLTTEMEYRTVTVSRTGEADAYVRVTDPDMTFNTGTYYIRYAADDNHNPSAQTQLTILENGEALIKTLNTNGNTQIDVSGTYVKAESISIDVIWGAMQFTYTAGGAQTWDPGSHTYTGDASAEGGWTSEGNTVTVTNHSNVDVTATFIYSAADEYNGISGTFDNAEATLESAEGKTEAEKVEASLTLEGVLADTGTGFTKVGTVTVTIGKAQA